MDTRYSDSSIDWLFSRQWTYRAWAHILRTFSYHQAEVNLIPARAMRAIAEQTDLLIMGNGPTEYQMQQIADLERETQHDVAAFLYWWEDTISADEEKLGRYIAYGLTSSDLVDTALGMRFKDSNEVCWEASKTLAGALQAGMFAHRDTPVLAHTHGQAAEPTRLGLIYESWGEVFTRCFRDLDDKWMACAIGKLSGPVGTFAYTPPDIAESTCRHLGLTMSDAAMQIVPRDRIARWASAAALLVDWIAKIGLDFRLAATRGEIQEAYGSERVGSSSMPHKVNPVRAEQLAGMARLAAGYAAMLQTTVTWEQRDIAHSSVERIAIPDLMHVVLHSMRTLGDILNTATWDTRESIPEGLRAPYSAWAALRAIDAGHTRREARETARRWVAGMPRDTDPQHLAGPGPAWFGRQHPSSPD